ncbi:hypothetical protein H0H81_001205 [Sphagnurus paluster]|uniref:Uncharacterized protein n=1 Tax=Sphagnurus paluster TaxID=117069 RepID=A0A9P7KJT3_9AGAR|nr:hypothetical protein H0H81_001205 [Sphagnurus paluster]
MIHAGYGCEFGLPGMVVEALASAAVHEASTSVLLPESLWTSQVPTNESLTLGTKPSTPPVKNVHAFTIVARILRDQELGKIEEKDPIGTFTTLLQRHGEYLNKYLVQWTYDRSDPREPERKIEEIVWTNTIIFGIGGWSKGKRFNSDFLSMHLVTSSLFLSSITANLKPESQELLLRGYFGLSVAWWLGRGRPGLDIAGFFSEDTSYLTPDGPFPTPHANSLPSATSPKATTPNPWLPIIQTSIVTPDDHTPKLYRALAHYGSLYGSRAPGQLDFAGTELPFAEKLDGSLFIRVAGLASERLFRKDLDVKTGIWERHGFFGVGS